jgi:hypothetical protein
MKKLFGTNISPSCEICFYHRNDENGTMLCTASEADKEDDGASCSHFRYDPLLRKPTVLPPLKRYTPEDFSL